MRQISTFLVDDHPVVLEGLRSLIHRCRDIYVVGEARSGTEALHFLEWLVPDVVVLDLELPDMNGIEVVDCIRKRELSTRILVLSAYDSPEYVRSLMEKGVDGYLIKDEVEEKIEEAILRVHYGDQMFSNSVEMTWHHFFSEDVEYGKKLTDREIEVARLLAQGWTNKRIGEKLEISEKTVEKHMQSIFLKLDVHSRVMAAVELVQRGIIGDQDASDAEGVLLEVDILSNV